MSTRTRRACALALCAVLLTALTGCAAGNQARKETNVNPLAVPPVEEIHLANGLTILLMENHQVPYVAMRALCRSGSLQEDIAGTANLMTTLMTYGTKQRTEVEISEETDGMGATLGTTAGRTWMQVHGDVTTANPEHLERFFKLFADVLLHPVFPADALDRVRKRKLGSLLAMRDNNASLAARAFHFAIFDDHPFGRPVSGTPESLKRIQREDLLAFHQMTVVPEQTILGVAGDIDRKTLKAWAEELLGDPSWGADGDARICIPNPQVPGTCKAFQLNGEVRPNRELKLPKFAPSREKTGLEVIIVDKDDPSLNQVQWRMGHQGSILHDHPEWYAWRLATQLVGGDFTARLNQVLRVREGLTYGAHLNVGHATRVPGSVQVATYVKPADLARAVELALGELDRALTEPIPEAEIQSFQSKMIEGLPFRFETPMSTLSEHVNLRASDMSTRFLEVYPQEIARVTPESAQAMLREGLKTDGLVLVAVGNADLVDELTPLAESRGGSVRVISVDSLFEEAAP